MVIGGKHLRKVLILGGTGVMGRPLVQILSSAGYEIHVTSRNKHVSDTINYIQGDAHDKDFLKRNLAENDFNAVVDFMSYGTEEFRKVVEITLPLTDQYIFISSARVYAESQTPLTESSARLLDVCDDLEYLATDEYALCKAREENILLDSKSKNWTIVRPSITYNSERLQLTITEKEEWLYRALKGRSIVFPKNLENIRTTMSHGQDVALAISKLVCNRAALGEVVHIAGAKSVTWKEVLNVYIALLEKRFNRKFNVYYIDSDQEVSEYLNRVYQVKYARGVNREFNNEKLKCLIGKIDFTPIEIGLTQCLEEFLDSGSKFQYISWKKEAYFDKLTGEWTNLREFPTLKNKIGYLISRFTPVFKRTV